MDDARALLGGEEEEEGECLVAIAAAFLFLAVGPDEAEAEEAARFFFLSSEASLAFAGRSIEEAMRRVLWTCGAEEHSVSGKDSRASSSKEDSATWPKPKQGKEARGRRKSRIINVLDHELEKEAAAMSTPPSLWLVRARNCAWLWLGLLPTRESLVCGLPLLGPATQTRRTMIHHAGGLRHCALLLG